VGEHPDCCPICSSEVRLWSSDVASAIEGESLDTYECVDCRAVMAWPQQAPAGLYEAIYQHADKLPGYSRYVRYARRSQRSRHPLQYLADQEDMYWAVARTLAATPRSRSLRIAEIGSGLGYLTNALRAEGYDCVGVDISETAVAEATKRFGSWYQQQDIFSPSPESLAAFDLVILLETIEHVPDPVGFLAAAAKLAKPDGRMLVTTPNRDSHPTAAIWRTDLAPVHLYWFTERTMSRLAEQAGFAVEFVDFTDFNAQHQQTVALGQLDETPPPTLNAALQPCRAIPMRTKAMERLRELPPLARVARAVYDRSRANRERLVKRSFSMAAVLTRQAE
jgi:SAM-dependent methyltransferase